MSNATIGERRERYHKAQRKRGLVLVQLWVPAAARDDVRAYAGTLRRELGVGDLAKPKPRKARKGPLGPNRSLKTKNELINSILKLLC